MSAHAELRGQISVTAPRMFGRMHVTPALLEFLRLHPQVNLRVLLADRVVDLLEEDLDVAVRIAPLPDSGMRAVPVGKLRRILCASPAYLQACGVPTTLGELARREAIAFSPGVNQLPWSFQERGKAKIVTPAMRMIVNSADIAVAAALAGHGIISVLSYQVAPEVAAGKLKIILEQYEPATIPVHVVYPAGRDAATKVRVLVDLLVDHLRKLPVLTRA